MARSNKSQKSDCVAALFSYEFANTRVHYDTIEAIHRGDVGTWVEALTSSGLFSPSEAQEFGLHWSEQPKDLLDLLLRDADEMTVRRCRTTWSALDRLSPLVVPVAYSG
ncbi:hypothetical protein GCM10007304_13200 [Rhodococcoides trifolii]|uniref:Uncharacterized protein n=1 Tax=Rhodococcoides trifolii TaxID=908250 RepID=A0A917CV24_9NOCA|nr:hypothetical protein [Rhodococcus trifolii]GGG00642.1 hypothetical protein GCM10007304_13200 [Rhodococcus trifolii]